MSSYCNNITGVSPEHFLRFHDWRSEVVQMDYTWDKMEGIISSVPGLHSKLGEHGEIKSNLKKQGFF